MLSKVGNMESQVEAWDMSSRVRTSQVNLGTRQVKLGTCEDKLGKSQAKLGIHQFKQE